MIAKRFRGVASVATAGLVIAVGAGCAPATDDSGSGETTLTVALADDYNTLDPALASTAAGYSLLMSLYDRLVVLDANGQIAPSLASEWEATPEVITFTLRD